MNVSIFKGELIKREKRDANRSLWMVMIKGLIKDSQQGGSGGRSLQSPGTKGGGCFQKVNNIQSWGAQKAVKESKLGLLSGGSWARTLVACWQGEVITEGPNKQAGCAPGRQMGMFSPLLSASCFSVVKCIFLYSQHICQLHILPKVSK